MSDLKVTSPLTHRERIALRVLMIIFQVAKPFDWSHEVAEEIKELRSLLKEAK